MDRLIKRVHGDGGKYTNELIQDIFYRYFDNELLKKGIDYATFSVEKDNMAFATESFVVRPAFFSGGNIGKLAVCGTINALCAAGSKPSYLSCSFIIEEGFPVEALEAIASSMSQQCIESEVNIVTGDTKVIEGSGQQDIYINISGIGIIQNGYKVKKIEPGDKIIVSGNIGEHGTAILADRFNLNFKGSIKSDCTSVYKIIEAVKEYFPYIKMIKNPTRGGLATAINELSAYSGLGAKLIADDLPISNEISSINMALGTNPLYMACEGRVVLVAKEDKALEVLEAMKNIGQCENAAIIGSFYTSDFPVVYEENRFGDKKIINMFDGEMLPRIC